MSPPKVNTIRVYSLPSEMIQQANGANTGKSSKVQWSLILEMIHVSSSFQNDQSVLVQNWAQSVPSIDLGLRQIGTKTAL